jgi:molecular chaperone GrpE
MTTGPNDDILNEQAPADVQEATTPDTLDVARGLIGEDAAPEDMGALLVAKLQAALAEIETLKDAGLRALAEGENIRRRAEREKTEARLYAIDKFRA